MRSTAKLLARDVRLTMGGEPTFVSIDDPDGPEWNTAALGEDKRHLAADLYHRLRRRYAPQGLAHFGQGKWYPGEPLPRWSLNCFWRTDGEPVWSNPDLLADESIDYDVSEATAQRFLALVAARLGIEATHILPAYEDAFYYLWRERRLPGNVDPFFSNLEDAQERARLARVFEHGLERAVGYVLPVGRDAAGTRWQTGSWFLRDERCYLVPGDSPLGYRLPLDSLPWVKPGDYPFVHLPDPMQVFPPLPAWAAIRTQLHEDPRADRAADPAAKAAAAAAAAAAADQGPATRRAIDPNRVPAQQESAAWITRTAMCAEPRDGVLYVFMPPTEHLEEYLELVAAVESAAEALGQPLIMEGYEPPKDPRLQRFSVTPDPGVIEVNIHPSGTWSELVERTTHLYEQAHQSRLSTEKFMLDGRHTGTGGGNHFVLGGATAPDSPFLRRPDLLRSLVSYWHNHPSLSYLFSGLFIGTYLAGATHG
ncbi:MAG: transglutaminase family protein [Steroidobacteraceae bacterium]